MDCPRRLVSCCHSHKTSSHAPCHGGMRHRLSFLCIVCCYRWNLDQDAGNKATMPTYSGTGRNAQRFDYVGRQRVVNNLVTDALVLTRLGRHALNTVIALAVFTARTVPMPWDYICMVSQPCCVLLPVLQMPKTASSERCHLPAVPTRLDARSRLCPKVPCS